MVESTRPKHVVVLDADNPLREIHGEFFWREDHEEIVAAAREAAYREGFAAGHRAALPGAVMVVRKARRSVSSWFVRGLVLLVTVAFLVSLAGNIVDSIHSP